MAKINGIEGMTVADLKLELQKGGKFVVYTYCISAIILTFRRNSGIYFIRAGENALFKGLGYTLLSLVAGWWGIPWGPTFTIQALWTNLRGGKDVTQEVLGHLARS